MKDTSYDLSHLPENKVAKYSTYLFVAISAVAWGCVAAAMLGPIIHLYARGQGRISALVGLELVPAIMCALSLFIPLWLRNRSKNSIALAVAIASTLVWLIYFYIIARLMAI